MRINLFFLCYTLLHSFVYTRVFLITTIVDVIALVGGGFETLKPLLQMFKTAKTLIKSIPLKAMTTFEPAEFVVVVSTLTGSADPGNGPLTILVAGFFAVVCVALVLNACLVVVPRQVFSQSSKLSNLFSNSL